MPNRNKHQVIPISGAIRAKENTDAQTTHGRILDFAGKFPQKEMGVMLVTDMHRAIGEDLFSVPEFARWSNDVAELMLYE